MTSAEDGDQGVDRNRGRTTNGEPPERSRTGRHYTHWLCAAPGCWNGRGHHQFRKILLSAGRLEMAVGGVGLRLQKRAQMGALFGLAVGMVFAAVASAWYLTVGGPRLSAEGVSLFELVGVYLIAGSLGGTVLWLTASLGTLPLWRVLVGCDNRVPTLCGNGPHLPTGGRLVSDGNGGRDHRLERNRQIHRACCLV